jgi:acetyl esterase/lipase
MKKVLLGILAVILAVFAAAAVYLYASPMPGVFLLRHAFGGEGEVQNPADYEEKLANTRIERDWEYPSKDGRNRYDLYLPKDAEDALPVIVWVHGGAFVAGDKSGVENWAVMLANEGYAVAAVDYEWAPEIAYPGQVRQVEECIWELQKKAEEGQPLDMNRVILAGDSAGAHIAAQAGLLATNPAYSSALGVDSALEKDDLKGMLLYCGPYNVEKILAVEDSWMQFLASRIGWAMFGDKHWQEGDMIATTTIKNYVTGEFPPTFLADGNSGSFEQEGKELAAELKENGVDVQSLFFDPGRGEIGHEYQFNLASGEGMETYEETVRFLKSLH